MSRNVLAVVALAALIVSTRSLLGQSPVFRVERSIVSDGAGPRRLPVDLHVLQHAARFTRLERIQDRDGAHWRAVDGLADVRLFYADGREVPYLLVYPPPTGPQWRGGALLPIDIVSDKSSGFELDLGATVKTDALQVEGIPAPFLKRLRLEGSGDRTRWTLLAGEATLFDLPQEALRQLSVPFTAGAYRYLRVTWNDANSGRVAMPTAARARLAETTSALAPLRVEAAIERRPSEPGRSRFRLKLPAGGLPVVAVVLDIGGGHVFRPATVTESILQGTAAGPVEIGRGTLTRVLREGAVAEDLRIPVRQPRDTQLELAVDDGSNAPLALARAWLELAELPWIYFDAPAAPVVARYGAASLQAPRYDLEATRPSIRIQAVADARWGSALQPAPESVADPGVPRQEPGPIMDLGGYGYERPLSSSSGLSAVALDAAVLAHSRGVDGSFADVRIVDEANRQIPYLLERLQEPLSLDLTLSPANSTVPALQPQNGRNLSIYAVRLPFSRLPLAPVVLETSGRLFTRGVRLGVERPPDRNHRDRWFQDTTSATWTHTSEDGAAPSLTLRPPRLTESDLLLVIDEGDNNPLPLTAVRLLLPAYRIRYNAPGVPVRLVYGREQQAAPQYDFELLASRILGAAVTEVHLGEERALQSSAGDRIDPLVSTRGFWIGLTLAVIVLGGLIVRLLRTS